MSSRAPKRRSAAQRPALIRRRLSKNRRPLFEPLEQRALLTVFVDVFDTSADAGGCGTFANPCDTIQAGVDNAPAGGEVYVSKGLYAENVTIMKNLRLRAEAGEVTIIPPAGLDGFNVNSPAGGPAIDVTIEDVAVTAADIGIQAGSVGDLALVNVSAISNVGDGVAVATAANVTIAGGTFDSNADHGIIISDVAGQVQLTNSVSASFNFFEGLEVTDAARVIVDGGTYSTNLGDGIFLDKIADTTRIGFDGTLIETAASNVKNGLNITRSGAVTVDGSLFTGNGLNGVSLAMVDAVSFNEVLSHFNTDAGAKIHAATSVSDTGSTFSDNDDHGLQLIDISGNVTLNRTVADDNDMNLDGVGDGLNATPADTPSAIGGDLTILGARFRDTDGAALVSNQERGAVVDVIGGIATIRDSFHTVQSVVATGNTTAGLVLMEGTTATLSSGEYSDNGGFGIKLENLDAATVSAATASGNTMNGLDVRMTDAVIVIDGSYTSNGSDGIELAVNASATLDGVTAKANGEHGVDAFDSGSISLNGGTFEDNAMNGLRVVASGDVALTEGVDVTKNKTGVHATAVASFSDRDGIFATNADHGILLEDITGDVSLTRTAAENNGGMGVIAGRTGAGPAIGGDLVVSGGRFRHTDLILPRQKVGIFADGVGGGVTFQPAVGPAEEVVVAGNELEGVFIVEGTTSSFTGGSFSSNGEDGIELGGFSGHQTLTDVTAGLNGGDGLKIVHGDDVTIAGGSFSDNDADGVNLFMNGDISISKVTANDNGDAVLLPNVGIRAGKSSSLTLSDLTLVGNDFAGSLIEDIPTVSFIATTGNTKDVVTLTGASIAHVRAGATHDAIVYGGVAALEIDTDDSDDEISASLAGLPASVSIAAGEQTDTDSLTVIATAGPDVLTLTATSVSDGSTLLSYADVEDLTVDAGDDDDEFIIDGSSTTVLGGAGDDIFSVNGTGQNELVLDGQGGSDSYIVHLDDVPGVGILGTVTISDSGTGASEVDSAQLNGGAAGDSFVVGPERATRDSVERLNYGASLETLTVQGLAGNDSFDVTPSDDTTINVDGGSPTAVPVGDSLTVQASGLTVVKTTSSVTVGSKEPVNYTDIEDVTVLGESGGSGTATDISLLGFGTAGAAGTSELVLSYDVGITAAPAFDIAFFTSDDARFDSADTEVGTRLTISDPSALALGIHRLTFDQTALDAPLADLNAGFVLAVVDPDSVVEEADESNNDHNFIGVFHRSTTVSPLVIRGRDDTDRQLDDDPNDVVRLAARGGLVRIAGNLSESGVSVPFSAVSEVRVVTQGGSDDVRANGRLSLKALGGTGSDTLRGGDRSNVLLGGDGNDDLRGGRSHDQLVGGDGSDAIRGSQGDDLIVGGRGADDLRGGSGNDVLIAGHTIYDATLASLDAVFAKWRATPRSYAARVARVTAPTSSAISDPYLAAGVTVFDDQVKDRVRGGSSLDLFFADLDNADDDDDDVSYSRSRETLIGL